MTRTSTNTMGMQARVDGLLRVIAAHAGGREGVVRHVVAYSGGVDSSLAAALVTRVFPTQAAACLGVSPSLSLHQLTQARDVAKSVGVELWECMTTEGGHEGYVENKGKSCYYCKTTLYSTIRQVTEYAAKRAMDQGDEVFQPVIYNGTNGDDVKDPTRVGLIAAKEYEVVSPLIGLTKHEVRETAKYLGLPNWNAAASPCLRSRLEFGIEATERHLKQVERAEDYVRTILNLQQDANMRVRFLAGQRAALELDAAVLDRTLDLHDSILHELRQIGFDDVKIRPFRSGSLSGYSVPSVDHTPTN